jgi:hypothetical protein
MAVSIVAGRNVSREGGRCQARSSDRHHAVPSLARRHADQIADFSTGAIVRWFSIR